MTTRTPSLTPGRKWDDFTVMPGLLYGEDGERMVDRAMEAVARYYTGLSARPLVRPLLPEDYGDKDGWFHPAPTPTRWSLPFDVTLPSYTHVILMHMESDLSRPTQPTSIRLFRENELIAVMPLWGVFAGVGPNREGGSRLAGFSLAPVVISPGERFRVEVALSDPKLSARIFFGGVVVQQKLELLRPEQEWVDQAKQAPVLRAVGGKRGVPGSETRNPLVQMVDEGDVPIMIVGDRPPSPVEGTN